MIAVHIFITILGINVTTGFVAPYTSVVTCIPSNPLTPKSKESDKIALAIASSVGVTISAAVLVAALTVTAGVIARVLIRRRRIQMYVSISQVSIPIMLVAGVSV